MRVTLLPLLVIVGAVQAADPPKLPKFDLLKDKPYKVLRTVDGHTIDIDYHGRVTKIDRRGHARDGASSAGSANSKIFARSLQRLVTLGGDS